jgi:hypothetical protein
VHEEDATDAEAAPSSAVNSLTRTVSAADADDAPEGCKTIIVMVEMMPVVLRPSRQKGCLQEACFEEFKASNGFALLRHKFFCKRRVGMVM